jgi:flagellar motility protein MotE (MotC chaperone)
MSAVALVVLPSASIAAPDEKKEPRFDEEAVSRVPAGDPTVRPGLAAELAEREKRLAIAEAELEETKKDLELARTNLEKKLEELRRLTELAERRGDQSRQRAQDEKAQKLQRLITTAEKMDPEAAASYLDNFPTATAAAILHGMKVRKAAAIIANMNASKAAALSRYYLENGQPPPDDDSK